MNTSVRGSLAVWGSIWAVAFGVVIHSPSAQASPIPFSTSGSFELPVGKVDLAGVTNSTAEGFLVLGTITVGDYPNALGEASFQLKFEFDGLPAINVGGTIPWIGYNPDMPVRDVVVSTTATVDQIGLYPELFRQLLAHPDWMHTTSFRSDLPSFELALSVHPEDPGAIRPVPEPSAALVVVAAFAGLAWKARRRSPNADVR